MQALKSFLLSITVLAISTVVCSQPYYFRHYEVEAGLSNNAVMCSVQDKLGFMWFGTRDGLNRFDGYTFKVYRFRGNNLIHALTIDEFGSVLVASEDKIYRYDPVSDSFTLLVTSYYFPIDEIISDRRGNIWFNASNILFKFSETTKQLRRYKPEDNFSATAVGIDNTGIVWVATAQGFVMKYNEAADKFDSYDLFEHSDKSRPRYINNILCTDDHNILIGTNKGGFKIFNSASSSYKDIPLCCEKLDNLFVRSFLRISQTEIWIGTETGIYVYNSQTGKSTRIQKNSNDPYSLSDNVIYTLCKDYENGIWAGTYFGGISQYPKQFTPFKKNYHSAIDYPLSGNIVRPITKDKAGNLWIGTEDAGLNKLDGKNGTLSYYKADNGLNSISYNCVHTLLAEDNNELWIGTYEHGLDIMNTGSGKIVRHYDASSSKGLRSNFPFSFFKDSSSKLIVGSSNGIYTYNRPKDEFETIPSFPTNEFYVCVLQDFSGTTWAAVPGKGVYYANPQKGKSGNFRNDPSDSTSLSNDKVNAIFQDSKKNLWFATENGLCKWDSVNQHFKNYINTEGFPSNYILGILEDEKKNELWLSTTKGLVCFNPENNNSKIYTTANGLLSDQFNFGSAFKDKDNRMYFGSAKGLINFNPEEIIRDSFIPPIYVTALKINNQEILSSPPTLNRSMLYTDKITLQYNQSTFSLNFAALGYTAPQNLVYAYQLKGLSNNWTYVKENRQANFTKLQPGTYIFSVKSSSTGGVWNSKQRQLVIEVLPAWWASNMAYFIYSILVFMCICLFFYMYHKRQSAKNRRKFELLEIAREKAVLKMEIAKEKEILESKIEFFTQVAHEIRTPVTLIKIPLSKVIRKTAGMTEIENSLNIIDRNTKRLIELSNQFLDFRKTEKQAFSLSLTNANISQLINDTNTAFANLAEQNNVDLKLELPDPPLFADVDAEAFTKIMYNLFSNAIKYARKTVHISLQPCLTNKDSFTILFKNDGSLIPEYLKEKIFEPFFRITENEARTGTGIGLALARSLAQIHGGSLVLKEQENYMNVFALTLPMAYDPLNNQL